MHFKKLYKNENKAKENNTLVSGNAGDNKNFPPSGRKFIFLIGFPEIFSFLH